MVGPGSTALTVTPVPAKRLARPRAMDRLADLVKSRNDHGSMEYSARLGRDKQPPCPALIHHRRYIGARHRTPEQHVYIEELLLTQLIRRLEKILLAIDNIIDRNIVPSAPLPANCAKPSAVLRSALHSV